MDETLQRQLLMADDGQRIDTLRKSLQTPEGREWCQKRFSVFDVLDWMWREAKGDLSLLQSFGFAEELRPLFELLVPDNYSSAALSQYLFPKPGSYRLDEKGLSGDRVLPLPSALIPLLQRRVREIKPLPSGCRLRQNGSALELIPDLTDTPRLTLSHRVLEESAAEMVAYGAKDVGEFGGGAAVALLVACGAELESACREALAKTSREVGEACITPAFGQLLSKGTRWVCHIISIKKLTSQGSYCPHPERLEAGVLRALELADQHKVHSMAFSALGTGEGRVAPEHCARLMIGGARKYFREHPGSPIRVMFCLPNPRDYECFENELAR